MRWVREPSSRWVRIPLALLLVIGGIFGFLPISPASGCCRSAFLLIAQDIPFLQLPLANALGWVERKWMGRKA